MESKYLDRAIIIAIAAHTGQFDKAGKPYILHPLTLMLKMDSIVEQTVAVLHDVLEDSTCNIDDLRGAGFKENVLIPLNLLTRVDNVSYMEYIKNLSGNPIARKVKIEDLKHNMNISRLNCVTDKDLKRNDKYKKSLDFLLRIN